MESPTVLCWVRSITNPIWNLPDEQLRAVAVRFPNVRFVTPADRDDATRRLPDADIVLGWAVRREDWAQVGRLRWIHLTAAGVRPQLFPEMVASDIVITNSRGLHAVSIAEHVLAMLLGYVRKMHLARDAQRERRWSELELTNQPPAFGSLVGATLGLVGLGAIGGALASRARALGMRVIAVRRHPRVDGTVADEEWSTERMGEMLERSDHVVLAVPHTDATTALIGAAELARMRPHATLVNIGRGALIDEPALIAALEAGRIAAAMLDVTAEEPLPATSPLWAMPNVILTPHVSGMGARYWERALAMFAGNLERWLAGAPLENVVDKRAGY